MNLNEITFSDIKAFLGPSSIIQRGDASTAVEFSTYFIFRENTYLSFISTEIAGDNIINWYKLSSSSGSNFTTVKNFLFSAEDFGGLRLGMNQFQIEQMLGVQTTNKIIKKLLPQ